jgi:outer membrane protein OmpA-like peptidoglycan-associated protein
MKSNNLLGILSCAGLVACATAAPLELVEARKAYRSASTGPAATLAPADLHIANGALDKAEQSFEDDKDSFRTRDLAYVAMRKSERAEAIASILREKANQTDAAQDYQDTQGEIVDKTKSDLGDTRSALAASERSGARTQEQLAAEKRTGAMTQEQLAAEKTARADADRRAAAAQAALAKMAEVKEEPRGMVITLSGSVLFASNQAVLLPEARSKLDQVADVLLSTKERKVVIEGHTDSKGTDRANMDLSQRRADAVRNYLVQREYQADLIQAHGVGEGRPIADNKNPEGRANNRRVEIIIARESVARN